jgi:putative salt-induced outer membrane protein YdiY
MKQRMRCNRYGAGTAIGLLLMAGISFAEDAEEEKEEGWTGELALAVNAQSGSTDTFAGSLDANTERSWDDKHLLRFRFNGVYGTTRSRGDDQGTETIQNSQGLFGTWKRRIHKRFFWATGTELSRDNTQDLELRASLATGPGYRIWQGEEAPKQHLDLSAGPGYRYEIYDGNTGGTVAENGDTDHYADLVAAFEYANLLFDDRLEYTHTGSARMPANDTSAYLLRSEVVLGVPLTEAWSFRTTFLVEYVASPGSDEVNNTTTRTSVGLGYKF